MHFLSKSLAQTMNAVKMKFPSLIKLKNLPTNVPTKNGKSGTPMTGEEILMNQLGKNGVMRKNMI